MKITQIIEKWDLATSNFSAQEVEERIARMMDLKCQMSWRGDGLEDDEAKEQDELEELRAFKASHSATLDAPTEYGINGHTTPPEMLDDFIGKIEVEEPTIAQKVWLEGNMPSGAKWKLEPDWKAIVDSGKRLINTKKDEICYFGNQYQFYPFEENQAFSSLDWNVIQEYMNKSKGWKIK